ncbi:hypothetical protein N1851_034413 [Merluccius polli]|uniref:Uncharacterized protein n=1 Tax=Merluccius polli TaxID=89951 RepID=A0AA47LZL7_MERPO|nr:hypothetical protein N1851_034413 [Merluccius polli]
MFYLATPCSLPGPERIVATFKVALHVNPMQARTVPIWKGAMSPAWDQRGAPIERSQPFTTRQMNINPCTTMATQHDPGTGGYNSMDSTCTSHDTRASGPTANYTGSAGGPKELASYTGHITAWGGMDWSNPGAQFLSGTRLLMKTVSRIGTWVVVRVTFQILSVVADVKNSKG